LIGRHPADLLRLILYPTIYRVLGPSQVGFSRISEPSTVSPPRKKNACPMAKKNEGTCIGLDQQLTSQEEASFLLNKNRCFFASGDRNPKEVLA